jgi:pimeloyl-ACP methyl ester carboxylesterase
MPTVTSKDTTSIAFDTTGQGTPLILVDGAICFRAFGPMKPLAELLSDPFTVYTYDRRGRGESTDTKPYAIEREIEDIEALIDEAGGSAYVYGISSGAALALRAARQLPHKMVKLALYEPPLMSASPEAIADYSARLKEFIAADRRDDAIELFMNHVGTPAEAIAGMRQSPVWGVFQSVAPTLVYDDTILGDRSIPVEIAAAITVPALVMDGGASPVFMRDAARTLAEAILKGQYRTLEGQTHEVAPDIMASTLIEYFAQG